MASRSFQERLVMGRREALLFIAVAILVVLLPAVMQIPYLVSGPLAVAEGGKVVWMNVAANLLFYYVLIAVVADKKLGIEEATN